MLKIIFSMLLIIIVVILFSTHLYAWEAEYTHQELTKHSLDTGSTVNDYLKNQLIMSNGLNTQLTLNTILTPVTDLIERGLNPQINNRTILDWIKTGSLLEDALIQQSRRRHHFYDPIRNSGLDNKTDHPDWFGIPSILRFDIESG